MSALLQQPPDRFNSKEEAQRWWTRACHQWQDVQRCYYWLCGPGRDLNRQRNLGEIDARERAACERILKVNGWELQTVVAAHEYAVQSNMRLEDHRPPKDYGFSGRKRSVLETGWVAPPIPRRDFAAPEPATEDYAQEWMEHIHFRLASICGAHRPSNAKPDPDAWQH